MEICVLLKRRCDVNHAVRDDAAFALLLEFFLALCRRGGFPGVTAASGAAFFCCSFATIYSVPLIA